MIGVSTDASHSVSETGSNGQENHLTYSFSFKEPELFKTQLFDNSFTKILVPGTITLGNSAGEPTLPVSFMKILLPPKTTIKSIDVQGTPVEIDTSINLKDKPILPYQNPVPIGHSQPEQIELNDAAGNMGESNTLRISGAVSISSVITQEFLQKIHILRYCSFN